MKSIRIPLAAYAIFTLVLLGAAIAAPLLAPSGACPLDNKLEAGEGEPVVNEIVNAPTQPWLYAFDARTHFVPSFDGGRLLGIRVYGAEHTQRLRALGLKSGDLIDRINDERLIESLRASEFDRAIVTLLDDRNALAVEGTRDGAPFRIRALAHGKP